MLHVEADLGALKLTRAWTSLLGHQARDTEQLGADSCHWAPGEKDKKGSEEAKREGEGKVEARDVPRRRERGGAVAGGLKSLAGEPAAWGAGRASTGFIL